MGLKAKSNVWHVAALSPSLSADWPVRIFYGLVTLYQGIFGIFVPTSIFYQALQDHKGTLFIILCLMLTGVLLVVDGVFAMVRYCTRVNCERVRPAMATFNHRRPWLFLPPVFCYYITLVLANQYLVSGAGAVISYYVMLALLGVVFCLRDGVISQRVQQRRWPHA